MEFLYFYFSFSLIFLCSLVFLVDNPVHSVLCLILAFLNAAIILLLLEVDFLGIAFMVIYVGAIAILFLFCVMMLNIKRYIFDEKGSYLISSLLGFIFFLETFIAVFKVFSYFPEDDDSEFSFFTFDSLDDINTMGQILYNYYVSCFLISGLVLLVAMIGSIVLTLNFTSRRKSELIYRQLARFVK